MLEERPAFLSKFAKAMKYFITRLTLAISTTLLVACGVRADGFKPINQPTGEYADLNKVANTWRNAVSLRKTADVAAYALPEARDGVARALNNKGASLRGALYGERTQQLLQNPKLRTLLIPHDDLAEHGMGTSVCFVGPKQQEPSWPISRDELSEFSRKMDVLCIFAFRADQRWYVSYEFANPGEGGDV